MDKKEKFINKAKKTHGDRYDYSKVEYINSITKVCIICPEHGEFWQTPSAHVRGNNCPLCADVKRGRFHRNDVKEFIEKAEKTHKNKYDYSKVDYKNARTKVCIICPEHGEFWQLPQSHIQGRGCPKCASKNMDNFLFIEKARKVHGDKYDYSKVNYQNGKDKICIICPEHGEFWQTPSKHLYGNGCPKCGVKERGEKCRVSYLTFLKRACAIHGNKYEYPGIENLQTLHSKITIICKHHGPFTQLAYDHLNGHGCPVCGQLESNSEKEIYEFICSLVGQENVIKRDRTVLKGKEIDIYIPDLKIGFEYNGLRWHSEDFGKTKNYHLRKTEDCERNGIRLIQIFEDEFVLHKQVVLSKIKHILGFSNDLPKIYARKCEIVEISKVTAKFFLNKFHIQGYGKSTIFLGALYCGGLVGVMGFKKNNNKGEWELTRFATDYNNLYCGLGSKMFRCFVKTYNPLLVKSFADRRWSFKTNNLYTKIGFKLDKTLKPDYRYVNVKDPLVRIHKFNFRKKTLNIKYGLPLSLTENEMTKKIGYTKIWDCGLYKYVWKSNG